LEADDAPEVSRDTAGFERWSVGYWRYGDFGGKRFRRWQLLREPERAFDADDLQLIGLH
jgi:hypothetical protein